MPLFQRFLACEHCGRRITIRTFRLSSEKCPHCGEKRDALEMDVAASKRSPATSFPILLGVLLGMIGLFCVASSPFMDYIITLVFGGPPSKALFAHPAYYCVHRTILLLFCLAGGLAGAHWSAWRRRSSFMFLVAVLLVIAAFAAIGFH